MEDELVQLGTPDFEEMHASVGDDDVIADKKKGGDEDSIIAVLVG